MQMVGMAALRVTYARVKAAQGEAEAACLKRLGHGVRGPHTPATILLPQTAAAQRNERKVRNEPNVIGQ